MLCARHNRVHECVHVCVNSQTVSEPEFLLSTYNISTDQSKDDYHLEMAGDYVLNTLLVSGLFVIIDTETQWVSHNGLHGDKM